MNKKHANPMLTRTGKTRLGPLNMKQLHDLLTKTQKKKEMSKIQRRINTLHSRGIPLPAVEAENV